MSKQRITAPIWDYHPPESQRAPFDFDFTLPSTPLQELAVRWAGYQHLPKGQPPNEHPVFRFGVIILIISGKGKFSCGDHSWPLRPGVALWALPGMSTRIELAPDSDNLEHYSVLPFGTAISDHMRLHLGSEVGAGATLEPDSIAHTFEAIFDEGRRQSNHRERNCLDLVRILLRRLDDQIIKPGAKPTSSAWDVYSRARGYIQTHFTETKELEQVATAVDVSIPYLCRLFERYDVTSPFGYLTQLKLTKADRLLQTTDLSIREIGAKVGYPELQLFSRKFKAVYGTSPSYYRRERREESERLGRLKDNPNTSPRTTES